LKDEIKKLSIQKDKKKTLAIISKKKKRAQTHSGKPTKSTNQVMRSSNLIERKMKKITKPNF